MRVLAIAGNLAQVSLDGCAAGEVVAVGRGLGLVIALGDDVTVALLRRDPGLAPGADVRGTGRLAEVPVGDAVRGRVIDPLGAALDGGAALDDHGMRRRLFARPLAPTAHAGIGRRLATGVKALELCAPLRRGAAIAVCGPDALDVLTTCVLAQRDGGTRCVIALVGVDPAALYAILRDRGALGHTTIVAAPAAAPPALAALAPLAALAIAEEVRDGGGHAIVAIDDLDRHAAAVSALFIGPPTAAEVYSQQAAMLARAGSREPARGGGSITVLGARTAPLSSHPTPLDVLYALDGAWIFEPALPGLLPALRPPPGLNKYARAGTAQALVPHSATFRVTLAHGLALRAQPVPRHRAADAYDHLERIEHLLEQPPATPVPLAHVAVLAVAAFAGLLHFPVADAPRFEHELLAYLARERPELLAGIDPDRRLDEARVAALRDAVREVVARIAGN